ncbi:EamA family transporter [Winogradskyella thalassocola]|uniref:EamA-like transporter family protein n=1 Tax=Winogradskyella thalassocola TaxID=262004 RepID=A0A1G8INJ0_9FLAO|nr:EamA family transporter [Winogradskyella thalassocola]SDI20484.1 EamA-like transporter family protein [Winogradskyella thalassocola]
MIYLILSILSSTGIFVLFKLYDKYKVNTLQAIVVNYITACTVGLFYYNGEVVFSEITQAKWFYAALGLGFLFIAIFNVMALTAQKNGLSVASVASKMSVIIPIVFGIYVYNESIGTQKIIGIILALFAVYLTSLKVKEDKVVTHSIYLPILLFLGSGIIDTSINHFAPDDNIPLFSATIFAVSAIIGFIILSLKSVKQKNNFDLKSIPFGIALGIVNYYSIYFLLKALRVDGFESSSIFTINNVIIVAVSTLIGLLLFKERISKKNWIGILIAIVSIILVTLT